MINETDCNTKSGADGFQKPNAWIAHDDQHGQTFGEDSGDRRPPLAEVEKRKKPAAETAGFCFLNSASVETDT